MELDILERARRGASITLLGWGKWNSGYLYSLLLLNFWMTMSEFMSDILMIHISKSEVG